METVIKTTQAVADSGMSKTENSLKEFTRYKRILKWPFVFKTSARKYIFDF